MFYLKNHLLEFHTNVGIRNRLLAILSLQSCMSYTKRNPRKCFPRFFVFIFLDRNCVSRLSFLLSDKNTRSLFIYLGSVRIVCLTKKRNLRKRQKTFPCFDLWNQLTKLAHICLCSYKC